MDRSELRGTLARALKLELAYPGRPNAPQDGVRAAVLVLFGFSREAGEGEAPFLVLTRRADTLERHRGQIAFPGGVCEQADPNFVETALRETEEEIGLESARVSLIGEMPGLWTATTNYWVVPVVGLLEGEIEAAPFRIDPRETSEAFWVSLRDLLAPDTYRREAIPFGAVKYYTDAFYVGPHRIWGATGSILKNLLDRLRSLS